MFQNYNGFTLLVISQLSPDKIETFIVNEETGLYFIAFSLNNRLIVIADIIEIVYEKGNLNFNQLIHLRIEGTSYIKNQLYL